MKLSLKLLLVTIVPLILYFVGLGLSFMQIHLSNNQFDLFFKNNYQRQIFIQKIYQEMGYGQSIHAFKNYIIRHQEKDYKLAIEKIDLALEYVKQYQLLRPLSIVEVDAMGEIQKVLAEYKVMLNKAKLLIVEGLSIPEIDKQVKVDDTQAIRAMNKLSLYLGNLNLSHQKEMKEKHQAVMISVFLISLIIMIVVYFFVQVMVKDIGRALNKIISTVKNISNKWLIEESEKMPGNNKDELKKVLWQIERLESLLEESVGQNNAIVETAIDSIISIDKKGIVRSFNRAAEDLFGYTRYEVIGKNVKMLMPAHDRDHHDQYIEQYLITNEPKVIGIGRKVTAVKKNEEQFPAHLGVSEYWVNDEVFFSGMIRDLSEEEKIKKSLIDKNEEFSQFAYRTSHDLRSPLITIKTYLDLIKEDLKLGKIDQVIPRIDKLIARAQKLESLINDIYEMTKAGLYEESKNIFSVDELKSDIEFLLEEPIKQNDVKILYDFQIDQMKSYKNRILQIIYNLVSNSVKYSDKSKDSRYVKVQIKLDNGNYCIMIEDNGLGIPKEHFHRVFKMFERIHQEVSFGSGLGMSIVKKHVEKLGGKINFESEQKKGTCFYVHLPV